MRIGRGLSTEVEGQRADRLPIRARLGNRPVHPWQDGNLPRNYHVPLRTTVRSPVHDWNPWDENNRPRGSEYPREIWQESARNVYQPERGQWGQYLYSPVHSTYHSPTRRQAEGLRSRNDRVAVNFDDYNFESDEADDEAAETTREATRHIKSENERVSDNNDEQ